MNSLKFMMKSLASRIMVPIAAGPLKGQKWSLFTNINYIKGTYVPLYTDALTNSIKTGDVVYDIGAHVGYFSVLSSILTGATGAVVAFEPFPINLLHLKKHVAVNKRTNVTIIESCIGDKVGNASFDDSFGTGTVRLSEKGTFTVPITTLDTLTSKKTIPLPQMIKMNIEGAEVAALKGAAETIRQSHPVLLISLHGKDMEQGCASILKDHGYHIKMISFDTMLGRMDQS